MERLLEAAATGRVLSVAVKCGNVAAHCMRFQQKEGASGSPRPLSILRNHIPLLCQYDVAGLGNAFTDRAVHVQTAR